MISSHYTRRVQVPLLQVPLPSGWSLHTVYDRLNSPLCLLIVVFSLPFHCWERFVIWFEIWIVEISSWSPYGIGQTIIFLPCGFFFLSSFFSSPNLSRRRLDVCHTCTYGVALVRISDAGLKRAAHGSLQTQDAKKSPKIAIFAPSHNFVWLYLCN